jgi:hypothetical protein
LQLGQGGKRYRHELFPDAGLLPGLVAVGLGRRQHLGDSEVTLGRARALREIVELASKALKNKQERGQAGMLGRLDEVLGGY